MLCDPEIPLLRIYCPKEIIADGSKNVCPKVPPPHVLLIKAYYWIEWENCENCLTAASVARL